MTANNYLDEVPATFNDLARRFAVPGVRADGVLESYAGKLAADALARLVLSMHHDEITPGQLWSALAAERGSVGACNMIANVARGVQGQLLENQTTTDKATG